MAGIDLHALSKQYAGGSVAVRDVSLRIADGEFLVLVGPSGCGKSTLLRLIAGLETPTAGRILIGGVDMTEMPPQARDLAMVFQSYALYPHMTVRANLGYGLTVRGTERSIVAQRVGEVAAMLAIDGLLDRRPAQLSGGERQRVALGRALVRRPQAFLFDEPLSNLDPSRRAGTRAELRQLHATLGSTMIYVTHDQEEAMTLAGRIAVMRDGALEQVAPPLAMYARPVNRFVAEFIGAPAMNLLPAAAAGIAAPPDTIAGIRPHDVGVDNSGPLHATVTLVEPRGADFVVHVQPQFPGSTTLVAVIARRQPPAAGEQVRVTLPAEHVHLFDGTTGRRLE